MEVKVRNRLEALRRLANDSRTPPEEADSARRRIKEMEEKYGNTPEAKSRPSQKETFEAFMNAVMSQVVEKQETDILEVIIAAMNGGRVPVGRPWEDSVVPPPDEWIPRTGADGEVPPRRAPFKPAEKIDSYMDYGKDLRIFTWTCPACGKNSVKMSFSGHTMHFHSHEVTVKVQGTAAGEMDNRCDRCRREDRR